MLASGWDRESAEPIRLYLAGTISVVRGDVLISESLFPGRQGRLCLAMLAGERDRAVPRDEIVEELWGGDPPPAWEQALRALVSKLRSALTPLGIDRDAIEHSSDSYRLQLPVNAWVDLESAEDAAHRAEAALLAERWDEANGWALVANAIARRPFLAGEDGPWATRRRATLTDVRVRALECRADVSVRTGRFALAVNDAELALQLEPFRETAHRLLMRAHVEAGNSAEALRAYERYRDLLSRELGVGPSPETESIYLAILRSR